MTEGYVPEGPACDFCTDWPAVATMMNLADYQTQRFCATCGPAFLLSIVEAMTGVPVTPAEAAQASDDAAADAVAQAEAAGGGVAVADDAADQGADDRPWPAVSKVVRSTHGHRGGREAKADDPE